MNQTELIHFSLMRLKLQSVQKNRDIKRVLTSERGGFIGSKSIVLLGKESPSGARRIAAKQAC